MRAIRRLILGFVLLVTAVIIVAALPEYFPDHGTIEAAIFEGDVERVQLLLERGADPNSRTAVLSELSHFLLRTRNSTHALPELGERPPLLSIAIMRGEVEIARHLLEAGADPNARDERGYTPLSYAALSDAPALVELLLARGADASLEMPDGSTALREGPELNFRRRPENAAIIGLLEAQQQGPAR